MDAGKILINGIFNGSQLLEVPFYQRAYVWKEEQWDRLLEDMEFVTRTKKPYFTSSPLQRKSRLANRLFFRFVFPQYGLIACFYVFGSSV